MAERPGHLVPITFDISLVTASCAQYIGDFLSHTGLLGYADNHCILSYVFSDYLFLSILFLDTVENLEKFLHRVGA